MIKIFYIQNVNPKDFLISNRKLTPLFRSKFNSLIHDIPEVNKVKRFVFQKEYVIDVKNVGDGENAFNYLAAYTQRLFLSNDRIKKYDGSNIRTAKQNNLNFGIFLLLNF